MKSLQKPSRPDFTLEQQYDGLVCGIDEVGRGPLAGPVMAACVIIPPEIANDNLLLSINDSKKLSLKKRESLFHFIQENCYHGLGTASVEEIDQLNIHHATLLAMQRAYETMTHNTQTESCAALVDGKFVPDLPIARQAVTKGDSISLSIAAASIVAKVTRDEMMANLHENFPAYGWERNAGYGTAEHLAALKEHGATPHHRRSFAPVMAVLD